MRLVWLLALLVGVVGEGSEGGEGGWDIWGLDWVARRRELTEEALAAVDAAERAEKLAAIGRAHQERELRSVQMHFHVPRAAGTLVCGLVPAWRSPWRNPPGIAGDNCWPAGGAPYWFGPSAPRGALNMKPLDSSCARLERRRRLDRSRSPGAGEGAGFLAPERALDDHFVSGGFCRGYAHSVVLREPAARARSQFCLAHQMGHLPGLPAAGGDLLEAAPGVTDNAQVRFLAGLGAFARPRGGLTERHLADALGVLRRLDVVFPMEELLRDDGALWAAAMVWGPVRPLPGRKSSERPDCPMDGAYEAELAAENHLDAALLAEARRLFALDAHVWRALQPVALPAAGAREGERVRWNV